jgi:hypothetical protein
MAVIILARSNQKSVAPISQVVSGVMELGFLLLFPSWCLGSSQEREHSLFLFIEEMGAIISYLEECCLYICHINPLLY